MITNILSEAKGRKNYYRNNLHRVNMGLLICMFVILILIALILYYFFIKPEPYYYATAWDGELTQLLTVPQGTGLKNPVDTYQ